MSEEAKHDAKAEPDPSDSASAPKAPSAPMLAEAVPAAAAAATPAKVQVVVVLYQCPPQQSPALNGLLNALRFSSHADVRVLVYDNSTEPQEHAPAYGYVHDPENGGLIAAYTCALEQAKASGCGWLLLLDHDTHVSTEFVQKQLQFAEEAAANGTGTAQIAAVVPRLKSRGRKAGEPGKLQSPHAPVGTGQQPLAENASGVAPLGTTAFNSGAMLRVSAIEQVGGFPQNYWLDYLDHAMFARLAKAGLRVHVLPVTLDHAMSWDDPAVYMGLERFTQVLAAERQYLAEYGSFTGQIGFTFKCIHRAMKYSGWPDKRYAQACWRAAVA